MELFSRELDLWYLETTHDLQLMNDKMTIFYEAGENKTQKTEVIKKRNMNFRERIKSLFEKFKAKIEMSFTKSNIDKMKLKISETLKEHPELRTKKVELTCASREKLQYSKKTIEKLKKAKTPEEVDRIMSHYNMKRRFKLFAIVVAIGLAMEGFAKLLREMFAVCDKMVKEAMSDEDRESIGSQSAIASILRDDFKEVLKDLRNMWRIIEVKTSGNDVDYDENIIDVEGRVIG